MPQGKPRLPLPHPADRREQTQRLLDHGRSVRQGVEQRRPGLDGGFGLGAGRAEDGVELGADEREGRGVGGKEVVGEAEGYGGGVVAGEEGDD